MSRGVSDRATEGVNQFIQLSNGYRQVCIVVYELSSEARPGLMVGQGRHSILNIFWCENLALNIGGCVSRVNR